MMKVESRAELRAIQGKKPASAPAPAADTGIQALAQAVQDSALETQRSMLLLAEAMIQNRPEPRPKSLIADVERDEFGKMTRVIISVER